MSYPLLVVLQDLFHVAGDEISAAMSANFIAKCHLEPTFVPHVFFQIPLEIAHNLSSYSTERLTSISSSKKIQRSNSIIEETSSMNSNSSPNSVNDGNAKFIERVADLD